MNATYNKIPIFFWHLFHYDKGNYSDPQPPECPHAPFDY